MRADLDLLRQIPSASQAFGAGLVPSATTEPAGAATGPFLPLLMQRLGSAAVPGGEAPPPEPPAFEQTDVEIGIDPAFVAIPLVGSPSAPIRPAGSGPASNVPETVVRVDVSTPMPRAAVPPLPTDPGAGRAAAGSGPQPRAANDDSSAAPNRSPLDPSDTAPLDAPPRSAAGGSSAQTSDIGLGRVSVSARSDPEPTPPARPDPPSASDTAPGRVEPANPPAFAPRPALSPEPTVPSVRPDPAGRPATTARLREDLRGTTRPGREKQAVISPLSTERTALVAPESSPLGVGRPIAPSGTERERPDGAPSLGTSPASPPLRESSAALVPSPAERAAPPPPTPAAAVVQQVEWLAQQGGGTARLRLSPASLGEIEVQVELQQGRVVVLVRTREQAGQQALVAERAAITQLFGARDLRVTDFAVTPMDDGSAAANTGSNPDSAASRGREHGFGAENRPGPGAAPAFTAGTIAVRSAADTATNGNPGRLDVRV